MRYTVGASRFLIVVCLVLLVLASAALADTGGGAQKEAAWIYLWSKTDTSSVTDGELAGVYREADAELIDQIKEGLQRRGMRVAVVRSEREIGMEPARFTVLVAVDKIELGGKRPFGRTAKVKIAYALQNKDRFDLIKRTHEETSVQKWQNCVKKISEQLTADVANDIARNSGPQKAEDKQDKTKQASPAPAAASPASGATSSAPGLSSPEARLQQLENLKTKGLLTQEEYEAKRKAIVKEL